MDTVYTYGAIPVADIEDVVELDLPAKARVLSAVNQNETLCVYAMVEVDPVGRDEMTRPYRFRVAGTGHPLATGEVTEFAVRRMRFLNTVLFAGGALVFHVFEVV